LHGLGDAVAPDDRGPPGEQADDQPAGDGGDDDPRAGPQLGERRRRPVPAVEQRQAGDEPDEVEQGPGGAAAGEPEPGGARAEEGEATGISHCDGKLSQCDVHDANRGPGRGNLAPVRRRPTAMRSVHRATTARPAAATLAALLLAATLAACGDDGGDEGDRAAPADVVVLAADVERVEPGPDAPVAEVVAGIEGCGPSGSWPRTAATPCCRRSASPPPSPWCRPGPTSRPRRRSPASSASPSRTASTRR